jgi:hypothetical protein
MAAVDYDARSFKKALAQRGTCIDGSWVPARPFLIGNPGCVRSSAWI